jgi:hypothetical protein
MMSTNILDFPKKQSHVIVSLCKTAEKLEKDHPRRTIEIQKDVIKMLMLECRKASIRARASQIRIERLLDRENQ